MQDKKKLLILGVLVVVILGVGAFSFMGGSSTPPPVAEATPKKDAPAGEGEAEGAKTVKVDEKGNPIVEPGTEEEPLQNPLYAAQLPQRDPFANRTTLGEQPPQMAQPQVQQPLPKPQSGGRRIGSRRVQGGAGYEQYKPMPVPLSGQLPAAGGGGGGVTLSPDPSSFGYSLSGTMTGSKPIAVFSDSNGNQRMVPVGGSLDGDSKVVAVEKGSVTIEHRGKKQRLSLGGNPK